MDFSNTLIYWYLQNDRDLPWRKSKNPYFIWLSEMMLQQTRVASRFVLLFKVYEKIFQLFLILQKQMKLRF